MGMKKSVGGRCGNRKNREHLKCRKAYAIMSVGKNDRSAH